MPRSPIQSRMPVTHWILSWQENEQPTREQVDEAVSLFLRGMRLAEHQTFYALHKNTVIITSISP